MHIVIAYDICTVTKEGQKRLRKVAQTCLNYGQRVQNSVFECQLNDVQLTELVQSLNHLIRRDEDSVRIYRVNDFTSRTVVEIGKKLAIDFTDPLII